jgi:hypothetical protein
LEKEIFKKGRFASNESPNRQTTGDPPDWWRIPNPPSPLQYIRHNLREALTPFDPTIMQDPLTTVGE